MMLLMLPQKKIACCLNVIVFEVCDEGHSLHETGNSVYLTALQREWKAAAKMMMMMKTLDILHSMPPV